MGSWQLLIMLFRVPPQQLTPSLDPAPNKDRQNVPREGDFLWFIL